MTLNVPVDRAISISQSVLGVRTTDPSFGFEATFETTFESSSGPLDRIIYAKIPSGRDFEKRTRVRKVGFSGTLAID